MAAITAPQVTALNPSPHLVRLSPHNPPQMTVESQAGARSDESAAGNQCLAACTDAQMQMVHPRSVEAALAVFSPSSSSRQPSVSPPAQSACRSNSPDAIAMQVTGEKRPAVDDPSANDAAAMRPRKLFAASIPPLTIPAAPSTSASLAALSTAPLRLPSLAPAPPPPQPQAAPNPPTPATVTLSISYPTTPLPVLPPRTRYDPVAFARGMQALQGTPLGRLLNATPDIVVDGVPRRVVPSKPPSSPATQGAMGQSASPVPLMQLPSRLAGNLGANSGPRASGPVKPRLLVPSPAAIASAIAANAAAPSTARKTELFPLPSASPTAPAPASACFPPAAAPPTLLTCPIVLPRICTSAAPAPIRDTDAGARAAGAAFDPLVECEESLDSLSDPSDLTSPTATSACSRGGCDAEESGAKDAMSSVALPRGSSSGSGARWGRNRSVTSKQTAAGRRRQVNGKSSGAVKVSGGASAGAVGTDGTGACVVTTSGQRPLHTLHPAPAPPVTAAARLLLHSASARSTSANPAAAAAAAAATAEAAAAGFGFVSQERGAAGVGGGAEAAAQMGVAQQGQWRGNGGNNSAAQLMVLPQQVGLPPRMGVSPQQPLLSLSLPPPTARNQGFMWQAPRPMYAEAALAAPDAAWNAAGDAAAEVAGNRGQEALPDTQLTLGRSLPPPVPAAGAAAHVLVGSGDFSEPPRAQPHALVGPSLAPEQSASVSSSASTTVVTRTESQGWSDETGDEDDDEWGEGDGDEAESEQCGGDDGRGNGGVMGEIGEHAEEEAEPDGAHALVSAATPASVTARPASLAANHAPASGVIAPRASRLVGSHITINGLRASTETSQSPTGGMHGSGAIRSVGSAAAGTASSEQLRESMEQSPVPMVFASLPSRPRSGHAVQVGESMTALWANGAFHRLVGLPCCSWLLSLGAASLPTVTLDTSSMSCISLRLQGAAGGCPAVVEGGVRVRWQGREGGRGGEKGEGEAVGMAVGRRVEDSEGAVMGYLWELRLSGEGDEVMRAGVNVGEQGEGEEGKGREEGAEDEDTLAAESLLLFTGGMVA
ncbi:unnamed protein product [Closterium sp. Yama58-4]|nr:unnamed protein product [Closterium sp. Yama58-4]